MAKDETYKMVNGEMILISSIDRPDSVYPPNWRGITDDLFNSTLFSKAITSANPNVYATFTKVLTDGEHSGTKEEVLKSVLQMFTFFTADDIVQLNTILSNNNFTIRL